MENSIRVAKKQQQVDDIRNSTNNVETRIDAQKDEFSNLREQRKLLSIRNLSSTRCASRSASECA